jgi:D-sedoheptulose 7-phosphate isomerase
MSVPKPAAPSLTASDNALENYFLEQANLLCQLEVTSAAGQSRDAMEAVNWATAKMRAVHDAGNKLIFVGNGGSAAIASHMATDYSKNGNVRSVALNDASTLTCLANDLGFDRVFAKQLELHARHGDLVLAISSSGRSANILRAAEAAQAAGCTLVTLTGFNADNPLRRMGEFNFYIASDRYGFVEIGHLTICHAMLDMICGLPMPSPPNINRPI